MSKSKRRAAKAGKLAKKQASKADKPDIPIAHTREEPRSKVEQNKADAKDRLIEALRQTGGVVSQACEKAGLCRDTYYRYYDEDPEFVQRVKAVDRIAADEARQVLRDIMLFGDHAPARVAAAKTILAAKDREGGFGTEIREQKHSGEIGVGQVTIVRIPRNGREPKGH